ncbi:MAG: T9SS C-terminal target domain-containing protein [Saprospirales bacterium]|nr:MAG: T9SS C-terminal target domain-containing protein [Saprospirales bacterium]
MYNYGVNDSKYTESISLENVPSGTYFIKISSGNSISEVLTIVKQ